MSVPTEQLENWLESLPKPDGFPQISPQRQYAHAEDQYDEKYGNFVEHPEEGQGLCALLDSRNIDSSGAALEIGCGTGHLTTGLARHCCSSTLLVTDPSLAFLKITQKRISELKLESSRLRYALLNADDLHLLPPDTFSVIALRSTLHHILKVEDFIAACAATLRPNGALVMSSEPCESGYVLMGIVAQSVPAAFQAAGVELRPKWARELQWFIDTIKFYCQRDIDKSTAEDKHLFRVHELSAFGARHGLHLEFFPNAIYADVLCDPFPPLRPRYFTDFFLIYLRACMSFDVLFVDLIRRHLKPQLDYLDDCYRSHTGPVFNGVFLYTKTLSKSTK